MKQLVQIKSKLLSGRSRNAVHPYPKPEWVLPEFVLPSCARPVNLVAEDENRAVGQLLIRQQRVQFNLQ
jgi:hypothetical protein